MSLDEARELEPHRLAHGRCLLERRLPCSRVRGIVVLGDTNHVHDLRRPVDINVERDALEREPGAEWPPETPSLPLAKVVRLAELGVDAVTRRAVAPTARQRDLPPANAPRWRMLERQLVNSLEPPRTERTDVARRQLPEHSLKRRDPGVEPSLLSPLPFRHEAG